MNNEGKDAVLSREQVERYYAEVTSPDELGITDPRMKAVFDMALRAEELQAEVERLTQLCAKHFERGAAENHRADQAERKLSETVAALKRIASNTCCDTCREAALVAQEAINEATK